MKNFAIKMFTVAFLMFFSSLASSREYKNQLHAHRGGLAEFDENTLSAFKGCYEKGIRGFETDVRLAKDGTLVILHDNTLERMTGDKRSVEDMTAEEIGTVRTKKGNPILFFEELLDYLADKPDVYLEIEMKTSDTVRYPQALVEEYCHKVHQVAMAKKPTGSTYVFTSFDKRPLRVIKAHYPDAELMLISGSPCSDGLVQDAAALGLHRLACTMPGSSRAAVVQAQKAGFVLCGWPGHSIEDYMLGVGLGFDHICSDLPVQVHNWINRYVPDGLPVLARQRDGRVREYVSPTRIVWKSTDNRAAIRDVDNLLRPGIGQSVLGDAGVCRMISTKTEHPAILLDFGKELQGGIQIVTGQMPKQNPVRIRVRFGESVSEAMCEIDGANGATNDHAMRDFEMELPWLGVAEAGNSGFRFARIDLLDDETELQLKEVRAIFTHCDIENSGSFKSNDERLNIIWETGAYTVFLNMQEYIWDGIKRDRLVWIGDLHPEVMTVGSVFGFHEVVPKSLDLIRDATPIPAWMNGMCAYSLWWVMIQRDWYYFQGDFEYLKRQQPYLTSLMNHLFTQIDPKTGQEKLEGGGRFLDWPTNDNPLAIAAGLQALMTMVMDCGEELFTVLDDLGMAEKCRTSAQLLRNYKPKHVDNKQAAALMALAGLMDAPKADKDVLSVGGSKNFSTFYGYYMLNAMGEAGNYTGALDRIREYWGAMLDLGATTFWEDFDLDWMQNAARIDELVPESKVDVHRTYGKYCYQHYRHSLCHGWASGPTAWLSRYVLGVHVLEPGCKTVRIEPHLGDLEWVEGTFPTPHGIIKIRHDKQADGSVKSVIDAPAGVLIVCE